MARREGQGTGCFHPPTVLRNVDSGSKAYARGWGGMPLSSRPPPSAEITSRSSSSTSLSDSSSWSADPAAGRQRSLTHTAANAVDGGLRFPAASSAELDVASGCLGGGGSCGVPVQVQCFDAHYDSCWMAASSDSLQLWPAAGACNSFGVNHSRSYTPPGLNMGPGLQAVVSPSAAAVASPVATGSPFIAAAMHAAASGAPDTDQQATLEVLDALDRELQALLQLKQELASQAAAAPRGSRAAAAVEGASAAHEAAMRHALSTRLLASDSLGSSPTGNSPLAAPQFAWPGSAAPMRAVEVRLTCEDPQVAGPVRSPGLAWPCTERAEAAAVPAARAASVQAKLQQLLLAQEMQLQLQQELLCLLPVGGC